MAGTSAIIFVGRLGDARKLQHRIGRACRELEKLFQLESNALYGATLGYLKDGKPAAQVWLSIADGELTLYRLALLSAAERTKTREPQLSRELLQAEREIARASEGVIRGHPT